MYISKSTVRRILKDAGACRVSDDASAAFQAQLNRLSYYAAAKAVRLADHAKRKTVEMSDIKLAFG
jgi:histone H3/H4